MASAEYMKIYYKKNPQKLKDWIKWHKIYRRTSEAGIKRLATIREFYNKLKCAPCTDCKKQYSPWVMQFDHRPETNKKHNVSNLVLSDYSLRAIKNEIKKCDLVCANCHAERTHKRRTGY